MKLAATFVRHQEINEPASNTRASAFRPVVVHAHNGILARIGFGAKTALWWRRLSRLRRPRSWFLGWPGLRIDINGSVDFHTFFFFLVFFGNSRASKGAESA